MAYITKLESQVKEQSTQLEVQTKTSKIRRFAFDKLMTMLANFQKTLYGQSSEKSKYVLGEDLNQLSLFKKRKPRPNETLRNRTKYLLPDIPGKRNALRKNWQRIFLSWRSFVKFIRKIKFVSNVAANFGCWVKRPFEKN